MATYPGMTLGGEIRESISLDDDDLSDVEDEVFIRDGKNGYKFAEDIGVKRPLMAPRRKPNKSKPDIRFKARYMCSNYNCKPACCIFAAFLALAGFTLLVVIIVSMFPVPINKIKHWMATAPNGKKSERLLPCSDLKVTDVWTVSLPKLTSESSIRTVDIDSDGNLDVIFGFGTGDNSVLHPDIFCPIFMGVAAPCSGGVLALNGTTGSVVWKKHLAHSIFTLLCSADLNGDGVLDCIATGKRGIFVALNSKDGEIIWEFEDFEKDPNLLVDIIYMVNFIPDQDGDGVSDIVAGHTSQKGRERSGHVMLVSGKTGKEIQRVSTPNQSETYYIPQLFTQKDEQILILIGTGSYSSPGNLTVIPLRELISGNSSFQTIYADKFKGVLSPAILVDITGDQQLDIVAAMFNSTIVAIDGSNFQQIWNVTVNNSETLSIPTPGYFNDDNVTDFFVKYQTGPEFPIYYYSQAFIIDGKTGNVIYDKPIVDSVGSQMAGLTLSMEGHGFDSFLFWTADCKDFEGRRDVYEFLPGSTPEEQSNTDLCKLRFNSTKVAKLYALNQFEQPPGLEIYSSDNRTQLEFNNTKTPVEEAAEYLQSHPGVQIKTDMQTPSLESEENFRVNEESAPVKYKDKSPFRHKDNNHGLIKDYSKLERPKAVNSIEQQKFDPVDYDQSQDNWQPGYPKNYPPDDIDYNSYLDEPLTVYTENKQLVLPDNNPSNRDPRGGDREQKSLKKNLSDGKHGIYDYKNVRQSKIRLLNDLNNVPTEILKDNYFKNRERQLRKSRFEQRDLKSHVDKMKENEEVRRVLEEERKTVLNASENLWTLESEKEVEEKKNGYWRGKRSAEKNVSGIAMINSIGVLLKSPNTSKNSIDLVFLTYWTPPKNGPRLLIEKDYQCIANKIKNALNSKEEFMNSERATLEESFKKECLEERGVLMDLPKLNIKEHIKPNFPYFNQIAQLSLGQMTVYRLRIECVCTIRYQGERCAKFLNPDESNGWSEYLNKLGDGVFNRV